MKKYKRKVDNKMKWYGDTDTDKHVIRINKNKNSRAKKNPPKGEGYRKKDYTLINTIVHEETHAVHPKMSERKVVKEARRKVFEMSMKKKKKFYSKYAKKS